MYRSIINRVVAKASIPSSDFIMGNGVTDAKYIATEEIEGTSDLLEKFILETAQAVK